MKRSAFFLCILIAITCIGCGRQKKDHSVSVVQSSSPVQDSGRQTAVRSEASASSPSSDKEVSVSSSVKEPAGPKEAGDNYPYDIAADRKKFKAEKTDITVGDKLYMTQINDWYINFPDYEGKSVVIEGYYMIFNDKYTFVGRKGPVCPYCTGGYVNFEFQSDQDLSALVSESSWIRVTGILRQGTAYPGGEKPGQPFCYIEAMKVEKLPQVGIDTITN